MISNPASVKRIAVATTLLLVVVLVAGAGLGAAHNPACHQTAEQGDDHPGNAQESPHYGGGQSADAADENNPTTYGDAPGNYPGSCTKGDAQSPHNDN